MMYRGTIWARVQGKGQEEKDLHNDMGQGTCGREFVKDKIIIFVPEYFWSCCFSLSIKMLTD